jgi:hypothetical protein
MTGVALLNRSVIRSFRHIHPSLISEIWMNKKG